MQLFEPHSMLSTCIINASRRSTPAAGHWSLTPWHYLKHDCIVVGEAPVINITLLSFYFSW
jgi:hypothetical protein